MSAGRANARRGNRLHEVDLYGERPESNIGYLYIQKMFLARVHKVGRCFINMYNSNANMSVKEEKLQVM